MNIHLPIAQMVVDPVVLTAIGALVGVVSGLFGVGGGFLLTPLLMFYGIPPAVAVSTQANQVLASSLAGGSAYWRRGEVDLALGGIMVGGGAIGSFLGVWLFHELRILGSISQFIASGYTLLLGVIGSLMLWESLHAIRRSGYGEPLQMRSLRAWTKIFPLRRRFVRSGRYMSVIPPVLISCVIGFLAAVLGIGGGFILAPAMVYLLGVRTRVMVGTSLFQIVFLTALVTVMHAVVNQTVDLVLSVILMIGGVVGARIGAAAGRRMQAAQLRALLGVAVLSVGAATAWLYLIDTGAEFTVEIVP